jgi:hypothetical protein
MMIYSFDWSGANGHNNHLRNIVCYGGLPGAVPAPEAPPQGAANWSRKAALEFLRDKATAATRNGRIVVGMDCAFSFPFQAHGNDFHNGSIDREAFWRSVWAHAWGPTGASITQDYIDAFAGHFQGGAQCVEHLRLTEEAARDIGAPAISNYHTIGPQVGKGSLGGISVLWLLTQYCLGRNLPLTVWPFFDLGAGQAMLIPMDGTWVPRENCLIVVETYPTVQKVQADAYIPYDEVNWQAVAGHFGGVPPVQPPVNQDCADALVAWYALSGAQAANGDPLGLGRLINPTPALVAAMATHPGAVQQEGWILGV